LYFDKKMSMSKCIHAEKLMKEVLVVEEDHFELIRGTFIRTTGAASD